MEKIDDSAQAIIIGGFVIAIGMIVVATLINGMIFSQNLDARGVQIDDDGIVETDETTEQQTRYILNRTQYRGANFPSDARDYYVNSMQNYTDSIRAVPSTEGVSLSAEDDFDTFPTAPPASADESATAWQYAQNTSREMTDTNGNGNWRVGIGSRLYMMSFLVEETSTDVFEVQVNDTNGFVWNMTVVDDLGAVGIPSFVPAGDTVTVRTESGLTNTCTISDFESPTRIKVFEGRVNGNPCDFLVDDAGLDSTAVYELKIERGDGIDGEYEIRLAGPGGPGSPGVCPSPAGTPCTTSDNRSVGIVHRALHNVTYTDTKSTHAARINETLPPQVVP